VVFLGWRGTVLVLSRWPYTVERSEEGRVGPADFGAPVEDRELGGGGEDGCAVHEMPLPKRRLASGPMNSVLPSWSRGPARFTWGCVRILSGNTEVPYELGQ
jgi:hypothetical protein